MFLLTLVAVISIIIIVSSKVNRLGYKDMHRLGMSPEKTLLIRSRPQRLGRYSSGVNEFALIEFTDKSIIRIYRPRISKDTAYESSVESVEGFGVDNGVLGQIQIYINDKTIAQSGRTISMGVFLSSGVVITPGTLFNKRRLLLNQVKNIANEFGIPISELKYPSDVRSNAPLKIIAAVALILFAISSFYLSLV